MYYSWRDKKMNKAIAELEKVFHLSRKEKKLSKRRKLLNNTLAKEQLQKIFK